MAALIISISSIDTPPAGVIQPPSDRLSHGCHRITWRETPEKREDNAPRKYNRRETATLQATEDHYASTLWTTWSQVLAD